MPQRYVVSELAFVSWRDGHVEITAPATRTTFTAADAAVLRVLSAFAVPRTIDDVVRDFAPDDVAAPIGDWIAAAILVDADSREPAAVQHWDRAALALHASSRNPSWRKTPGHSTPAVAPRRFEVTIP